LGVTQRVGVTVTSRCWRWRRDDRTFRSSWRRVKCGKSEQVMGEMPKEYEVCLKLKRYLPGWMRRVVVVPGYCLRKVPIR
jgi:hypothetical protein